MRGRPSDDAVRPILLAMRGLLTIASWPILGTILHVRKDGHLSLLDLASTSGRAQRMVERYPDKSSVQVHYNLADPSEAVLEPGSSGGLTFL